MTTGLKNFGTVFCSELHNDALYLTNQNYFDLVKEMQYCSPAYSVFNYLIDNYVRTNKIEAYSGDLYWDALTLGEMIYERNFPNSYNDNNVKRVKPFCILIRKCGTNVFEEGVADMLRFLRSEIKNSGSGWITALVFQPEWQKLVIPTNETPQWKLKIYEANFDRIRENAF